MWFLKSPRNPNVIKSKSERDPIEKYSNKIYSPRGYLNGDVMRFDFSNSLSNMRPSEIRELLRYATATDLISFGGGMPNPESFPVGDLKEIIDDLILTSSKDIFQYGNTGGLDSLRDEISLMLKEMDNISASHSEINVTSGSQQALYEIAKILASPGDAVITELPTYVGAISAFSANKLDMHGIPMDEEGIMTDKVQSEIELLSGDNRKPKFIYVIPDFQNPTGITLSQERRKHLLDISEDYSIPIVEDDPYSNLRYYGEPIPRIKSLDRGGNVIYTSTFSKVMCPGLRIGYVVGQEDFISRVNLLKQALDLSTNTLSEYIAREYIKRGIMKKQIPKTVALYRRKRDLMLETMKKEFPEGTDWTKPDGGMFIWASVDSHIDTTEMRTRAMKNGVLYVSGASFYPHAEKKNEMRINFSYSSDEDIVNGIRRLSKTIGEELSSISKTA